MIREGLLKENIDGEAILWAYDRAVEHASDRALIVVVSDGAPVDDSTLSVNEDTFLDRHLRATVQWLTQKPGVGIYGVGIGFDCRRYYPNGVTVAGAGTLGVKLFDVLPQWLSGKTTKY
jgi:cobaltochelatase CobT